SAKDKGTGKEQKMTITSSTKLNDKDIDKMMKSAKEHEEEDKRRKEEVEIRNNADSTIYMTEKTLSELGDKLPAEQKTKIEAALKSAKDAMNGTDTTKMKQEAEKLQKAVQEAGASIYQQAQDRGASEQKAQNGKDENVVEGEFKKEDK
ncbi:MAG: Hsp70 family protein, partial [Candidatus Aenigmarchaeota archaeon]|nr:Hsp70 family protein [Candidatus Aenigmarchaeota archaeon]